jgi:hypothetical protein
MDAQIKLGCLELAAQLLKPVGNYDVKSIVETATVLYNFTQTPPQAEKPVEIADKPSKRRKPTLETDILS